MVDRNWTVKQALEATEEWLRENPGLSWSDPKSPFSMWRELLKREADEFENTGGDGWELIWEIYRCAQSGIPMPARAADSFRRRVDRVDKFEAKSWDEVFGKPHRKGIHLKEARERLRLKGDIHRRILELRSKEPDTTKIGDALFERVAQEFESVGQEQDKEFTIRKTLVAELYYEMERERRFQGPSLFDPPMPPKR